MTPSTSAMKLPHGRCSIGIGCLEDEVSTGRRAAAKIFVDTLRITVDESRISCALEWEMRATTGGVRVEGWSRRTCG
jgi:hypothetical protein